MSRKKVKKYKGNSIIVLFLILSLSCQSIPSQTARGEPVNPITVIRENLPPDEETLAELQEASDLVRSYRQQLVSEGIPNFSYYDWQIANLLYEQTIQMEKSSTLRETQESIARYNLTAVILETLYASATNNMPIGGAVVYLDGDDMYWDFDERVIRREAPEEDKIAEIIIKDEDEELDVPAVIPAIPIITVPVAQIPAIEEPPRERQRDTQETEVTEERQPGRGVFIPDTPTREEVKTELITAAIEAGEYTPPQPVIAAAEESFFFSSEPSTTRTPVTPIAQTPVTTLPELPPPATQPPVTQPVTQPPVTQPVTEPPATQPVTEPAATQPTVTQAPPLAMQTPATRTASRFPAQYRVISWELYGDSLWNIAGLMYNDPKKWRIIFEANKHIMPDPDNPDLIVPDMILTIPSIEGEEREGLWDGSMGKP